MKTANAAAFAAFILVLVAFAAADIAIPTITKVYFDNAGAPYDGSVSFTVTCYGYSWKPGPAQDKAPGTYEPTNVFSFTADCPRYGCEVAENYYLNYRHLDWCDLNGTAAGKDFYIHDYSGRPVSDCNEDFMNRACTLRFSIPPGTITPGPSATPSSTPPVPSLYASVTPAVTPAPQKNFLSALFQQITCFILGLFGQRC
ncbi:MAG: hypothetical protein NTY90_01760 [Candidatus Micrarchaeota archaeon]|nr:hypothetical protein [Candidatus Micrarchaeota archaeon]